MKRKKEKHLKERKKAGGTKRIKYILDIVLASSILIFIRIRIWRVQRMCTTSTAMFSYTYFLFRFIVFNSFGILCFHLWKEKRWMITFSFCSLDRTPYFFVFRLRRSRKVARYQNAIVNSCDEERKTNGWIYRVYLNCWCCSICDLITAEWRKDRKSIATWINWICLIFGGRQLKRHPTVHEMNVSHRWPFFHRPWPCPSHLSFSTSLEMTKTFAETASGKSRRY